MTENNRAEFALSELQSDEKGTKEKTLALLCLLRYLQRELCILDLALI